MKTNQFNNWENKELHVWDLEDCIEVRRVNMHGHNCMHVGRMVTDRWNYVQQSQPSF